jgi:hypothetical protein
MLPLAENIKFWRGVMHIETKGWHNTVIRCIDSLVWKVNGFSSILWKRYLGFAGINQQVNNFIELIKWTINKKNGCNAYKIKFTRYGPLLVFKLTKSTYFNDGGAWTYRNEENRRKSINKNGTPISEDGVFVWRILRIQDWD